MLEIRRFLKYRCKTPCATTLIIHKAGIYLLISVAVIVIYAGFRWFSSISHLKRSVTMPHTPLFKWAFHPMI